MTTETTKWNRDEGSEDGEDITLRIKVVTPLRRGELSSVLMEFPAEVHASHKLLHGDHVLVHLKEWHLHVYSSLLPVQTRASPSRALESNVLKIGSDVRGARFDFDSTEAGGKRMRKLNVGSGCWLGASMKAKSNESYLCGAPRAVALLSAGLG